MHALSCVHRKASEQAYNSTTHPTEWHFLNRLVKSKKGTVDDITKAWEEGEHLLVVCGMSIQLQVCDWFCLCLKHACMYKYAGGIKRARLLRDFVVKVYSSTDDHSVNKAAVYVAVHNIFMCVVMVIFFVPLTYHGRADWRH